MNPENIKQIVETIKTLNINFNDATTQKIADAIKPIVTLYFFEKFLMGLVIAGVTLTAFILIYKLTMRGIDACKEKDIKRYEEETKQEKIRR